VAAGIGDAVGEERLVAPALQSSRQYSGTIVRMALGPDTSRGGIIVSADRLVAAPLLCLRFFAGEHI
jgi:hypothetical protein